MRSAEFPDNLEAPGAQWTEPLSKFDAVSFVDDFELAVVHDDHASRASGELLTCIAHENFIAGLFCGD
jgi:hypothetical protein